MSKDINKRIAILVMFKADNSPGEILLAQTVKQRLDRAQILLSRIEEATLPNRIFSDKKKFDVEQYFNAQNDRVWTKDGEVKSGGSHQKTGIYSVMVWAAVTANGRSPLVFVDQGIELKEENYQTDILEGSLLIWTQGHFKKRQWSFQQDSAPSHRAKKTQEWLSANVPQFISKEEWPPSSPELNPLDFSIWSILESKVSANSHQNVKSLKKK